MLTPKEFGTSYSTTQSSGDSTINVYWDIVNNRYINIHNKVRYAYDVDWIDGCIKDAEIGISYCDLPTCSKQSLPVIAQYKKQFEFIIKQLNLIKQSMTK